jgi:hypothetical protein
MEAVGGLRGCIWPQVISGGHGLPQRVASELEGSGVATLNHVKKTSHQNWCKFLQMSRQVPRLEVNMAYFESLL